MAFVRLLYFCVAQHNIHVLVTHVVGIDNLIADALSRFQVHRFHQLALEAAASPVGLSSIAILVLDISYRKILRYYYLSQFLPKLVN